MSIQLFIVCVYIALLFGISFYVKRRADKGSAEYLFAGRKLGTALIAVNITGLAVGAASTVGVAENAFRVGMAAGWYNAAWSAGAIVMGLVAAGKLRAMKISTIPEFFEKYYDTKGRVISAVGLVIIMSVITALQYLAGGAILAALLPDIFSFKAGMMVSAVVFIGITLIGGLWSSGLSNIVSVILIYVGILYSCIAAVGNAGGIDAIAAQLPTNMDWLDPLAGIPMAVIIGWFIVMITQAITAQGPVQIACGARDAKTARKGFILGGILIFPIGFLCALLGIVAKVSFPDITATMALPKVVMSLNPVASGTTLAALWAADVSTACTILLGAGTLFSQDIYKRFINPGVSDDKFVTVNRITIFAVGLVTLWFAFNAAGILKTMIAGLSMTTALTCVFLFTVFAPGLCRRSSAFYTTLVGLLGLVVWEFVPALHVLQHVIYFEWLICIVTFLLVAVIDKTPIKVPELVEEEA
ncbi:sodium:solute symporter family protein [Phascolarctobacterium sp.]|uniref:sodium:solute symporter family protein n=1 Tax=Phascolarctobacterium sp. TaxID=2049039 RepID=UPI0025D5C252|nr:sodium:solute symporter family protein [uncultured Phascolarctobacterium sp.]